MFLVSSRRRLRSIHWSQVLSWEWRCSWSSADRRCSNYIWVINNFITYWGATYIRGFTVITYSCPNMEGVIDDICHLTRPMSSPGAWFNIKMSSYQYRKSHCGDKTVVRSSYLHNGISYTGKTSSLYWIGALGLGLLSKIHLKPVGRWGKQTYGSISWVVDMYY